MLLAPWNTVPGYWADYKTLQKCQRTLQSNLCVSAENILHFSTLYKLPIFFYTFLPALWFLTMARALEDRRLLGSRDVKLRGIHCSCVLKTGFQHHVLFVPSYPCGSSLGNDMQLNMSWRAQRVPWCIGHVIPGQWKKHLNCCISTLLLHCYQRSCLLLSGKREIKDLLICSLMSRAKLQISVAQIILKLLQVRNATAKFPYFVILWLLSHVK